MCVYRTLRRERRCGVEAWQACSALHSSTDQERRRQDIRIFPSAVVAGPLDALFENLRDVRVAQQSCLYETGEREGAEARRTQISRGKKRIVRSVVRTAEGGEKCVVVVVVAVVVVVDEEEAGPQGVSDRRCSRRRLRAATVDAKGRDARASGR